MSYPEEPQPPTYRESDAGAIDAAPVSGPAQSPAWSGPAASGGWSGPPAGWSRETALQGDVTWQPPGAEPRDPVTLRPAVPPGQAYLADRTPPYAQAPVRPAYPPPPAPYPMMPRTVPMAPGNAVVPYVPQFPAYGYTVQHVFPSGYAPPLAAQNSGLSVASMVLGILGLVFVCCDFGILSLVAVILGHIGLAQTRDGARAGRGFAIAGLALGYTVLVPAFAVSVLVVLGNVLSGTR